MTPPKPEEPKKPIMGPGAEEVKEAPASAKVEENADVDQRLYHEPDCSILLWPDLGFITLYDPRFKNSLKKIEEHIHAQEQMRVQEYLWYVNVLHQMNDKRARECFKIVLKHFNQVGILTNSVKLIGSVDDHLTGNFPDTMSQIFFIYTAYRISKTWD